MGVFNSFQAYLSQVQHFFQLISGALGQSADVEVHYMPGKEPNKWLHIASAKGGGK